MNVIKAIAHDLVAKRLWPVALVLVALLFSIPATLAKPGDPVIQPDLPSSAVAPAGPSLSLARVATTGFARAPRVNDKRLDPFSARRTAKATKTGADALASAAGDVIDSGGGGATSTPNDGGSVPKVPKDTSTNKKKKNEKKKKDEKKDQKPQVTTEKDDVIAVLLQTGDDAEAKEIEGVRTLSPLPDTANPFLVYTGRAENADKAMFLVSADVTVTLTGGGTCAPSITDCRTLVLGVGETAKFTPVVPSETAKPMSVTLTDIETKDVAVDDGTEETQDAIAAEKAARVVGAKALKSVLRDDEIVAQLVKAKVKIRH